MKIPESVLQSAPCFLLIANFQPAWTVLADLSRSKGKLLGAAGTIDSLAALVSPANFREARYWLDRPRHDLYSHAIVFMAMGNGDSTIEYLAGRLLELVRERTENPQEIDFLPVAGDHELLLGPEWAVRPILRPAQSREDIPTGITSSDLATIWEDYVHLMAWKSGGPPEDFLDRLCERIDQLSCGVCEGAWDELDEYLWK